MSSFNTREIAEYQVSEDLMELIIENDYVFNRYNLFLQNTEDRADREPSTEIVVTDLDRSSNDDLIVELKDLDEDLLIEIVELVSVLSDVSETDTFDELHLYI